MVGTLSLALASRSSIANPMSKNSRTSLSDGSVCAIVATVYYAQLNSLKLRWWWWYILLVMNGTNDVDGNYNVKSWGRKNDECEESISSYLSLSSWFMRLTRFKEQTELGRRGKQGFIILTRPPPCTWYCTSINEIPPPTRSPLINCWWHRFFLWQVDIWDTR